MIEFCLGTGTPSTAIPASPKTQSDQIAETAVNPFRVLLVEDNVADVMVVEDILQQQLVRFEITVAPDGQKAIQLLRRLDTDPSLEAFDIALIDLNLPKHTGHEVLAELRNTKRSARIPVIIVTSSRSPSDIRRARELGANEYFQKVADLDAYSALGSLVLRILEHGGSEKN